MAISVSTLKAAGLTDAQIVVVFEKAEAERKERNRQRQADFQARKRANANNTANVINADNVIPVSEPDASRTCSNTNLPTEDISYIPPLPPKARNRGHRLPEGWQPDAELIGFSIGLGFSADQERKTRAEFCDYWLGVPGSRGCKLDWPATYRNRLREVAGKLKLKPSANVLPFTAGADPPKLSAEEQLRRAQDFDRRWKAGEFG